MNPKKQSLQILPPLIQNEDLVPTINDRLRKLQVMIAQQAGASSVLYGTHSNRTKLKPSDFANAVYFETDRNYVIYVSDGKQWHFAAGIMYGLLASRPSGLTANDEGFYYLTSDQPVTLYRWTKGAWVTALGSLPWTFMGRYSDLTTYSTGDVVAFEGLLWISSIDNNIGILPTNPTSDPPAWYLANWQRLADVTAFGGEQWDAAASYQVDAIVSYLGDLWIAKSNNSGTAPALQYPGDPLNPWLPVDADNIVVSGNLVGHGLNLRWGGSNWISGISPDNAGGAILCDVTTGMVMLCAVPELPNAAPPNNPLPQLFSPTQINNGVFLKADPRTNLSPDGSYPTIIAFWPFEADTWLLVLGQGDTAGAIRAKFDLSTLLAGDKIYNLPDNMDPISFKGLLAGATPPFAGTGILNVPGDGLGWNTGHLLIGSGPDTTELLAPSTDKKVLRMNAGLPEWGVTGDAAAGTYGDSTHVAQIVIDSNGRITAINLIAIAGGGGLTPGTYGDGSNIPVITVNGSGEISFVGTTPANPTGVTGTATLAKLTPGGTTGGINFVNGIATAIINPT